MRQTLVSSKQPVIKIKHKPKQGRSLNFIFFILYYFMCPAMSKVLIHKKLMCLGVKYQVLSLGWSSNSVATIHDMLSSKGPS